MNLLNLVHVLRASTELCTSNSGKLNLNYVDLHNAKLYLTNVGSVSEELYSVDVCEWRYHRLANSLDNSDRLFTISR